MSEAGIDQFVVPPQPAQEVRAGLKTRITETESAVLAAGQIPFEAVRTAMMEHPELGTSITQSMDAALNSDEQKLIASTALTVYFVSKNLPFVKHLTMTSKNDFPDNQMGLGLRVAVNEDGISLPPIVTKDKVIFPKKDNNRIYETLKEHMSDYPELAEYVAEKMRDSVSLEEANIVGETALLVYDVMKDISQSTTIYLNNDNATREEAKGASPTETKSPDVKEAVLTK